MIDLGRARRARSRGARALALAAALRRGAGAGAAAGLLAGRALPRAAAARSGCSTARAGPRARLRASAGRPASGYFAAALFWIVEPFLVDPERHGWMAPFALVGMAGGLALFWGAAVRRWRGRRGRPGVRRVLVLAALWTLAEAARSYVLTGFPWGLVAYAWIETPVIAGACRCSGRTGSGS